MAINQSDSADADGLGVMVNGVAARAAMDGGVNAASDAPRDGEAGAHTEVNTVHETTKWLP